MKAGMRVGCILSNIVLVFIGNCVFVDDAFGSQRSLPVKTGQLFVIDDFDNKVTQNDMGFNYFAGNMGAAETIEETTSLTLTNEPEGCEGGSLCISYDFTGQDSDVFAGFFASLFGLTDTLVSLDGSGQEPIQSTWFPGYYLDTQDLFRDSNSFMDMTIEQLCFDCRNESAEAITLKVELKDEMGFDVFTRITLEPNAQTWNTMTFDLPSAFSLSVAGEGDPDGFDWNRVSLLSLIIERTNIGDWISNPDSGVILIDNILLKDLDGEYPDLNSEEMVDANSGYLLADYYDAFLEYVRRTSMLYFLDFSSTDADTGGIVQDRSTFADLMTVGGVGFQLSAYCIAAERGDLSREEAAQRTLDVLRVLFNHPQGPDRVGMIGYQGFFYHFLGINGLRKQNFDFENTLDVDESTNTVELSTIDTALAMAGVVTVGQYFNRSSEVEMEIASLAEAIYARVDWNFMFDTNTNQFYLGWKPNENRVDCGNFGRFLINDSSNLGQYSSKQVGDREVSATIDYYTDEGLLIALLAMGSPEPDHRVGREGWDGMIRESGGDSFVKTYPGAMFTYTFASFWLDTLALGTDTHPTIPVDFFYNTQQAADATYNYVIENPRGMVTWSDENTIHWGLSAAEDPFDQYFAFAAPTAALANPIGYSLGCSRVFEAEDQNDGDQIMMRSHASNERTVLLKLDKSYTTPISVPESAVYEIVVQYSNDNDNSKSGEHVVISLGGISLGSFDADDTGDGGFGWNNFVTSEAIVTERLASGSYGLTLTISGGDDYGLEVDMIEIRPRVEDRALADGTVTIYGAASAIQYLPTESLNALWSAAHAGTLHPRFGFADAFNLEISDALQAGTDSLRTTGAWINFNGFAIDQGPMLMAIDNYLYGSLVPKLFMSHDQIRQSLETLFPNWDSE